MSYEKYQFSNITIPYSSHFNKMSNQVSENEIEINSLKEQLMLWINQQTNMLKNLSLEADIDKVYLYLGDELLSTVSLPKITNIIPCTQLNISFSKNDTSIENLTSLFVGDQIQIQVTTLPENCNQNIHYLSSNPQVAIIDKNGVLTAIKSGSTNIEVICGNCSQSYPVWVSRIISLKDKVNVISRVSFQNDAYDHTGIVYSVDNSDTLIGNIPYDFNLFKIQPGEKITLRGKTDYIDPNAEHLTFVFQPENNEKEMTLWDDRKGISMRYVIENTKISEISGKRTPGKFEYTNTTNDTQYLAFAVRILPNIFPLSEIIKNIDNFLEFKVGPLENKLTLLGQNPLGVQELL